MNGLHITVIVIIEAIGLWLGIRAWRRTEAVAIWLGGHGIGHETTAILLAKLLPVTIMVVTILLVGAVF